MHNIQPTAYITHLPWTSSTQHIIAPTAHAALPSRPPAHQAQNFQHTTQHTEQHSDLGFWNFIMAFFSLQSAIVGTLVAPNFSSRFYGNSLTNLRLNLIPSEPLASLRSTKHVPVQLNPYPLAAMSAFPHFEQTFADGGVPVTSYLMDA